MREGRKSQIKRIFKKYYIMKQFSKDLGNVSLAPKGKWSREQEYERLALVYNACDNLSYVAKIDVPSGVNIENREYWQPMNATGYADNNFINLTTENENGTITAYESLEEAVATILPINRRAGATLSFYNLNSDRLDRQAEFELWQFNSTDLANWENRDYWNNVYYNWNVFVGWYIGADALKNHVKLPTVGQYAYVGSNLNDAILYQCRTNGTWTNTGTKVRNYMSVVVSGNITIGDNGNWFSDGKDTGIPATPVVDEQLDNIGLQLQQHATEIDKLQKQDVILKSNIDSNFETINNKIDVADENLQNQITSNDNDIATLNTKHESLSKTVKGIAATGGASTATNVTYDKTNSGLNAENAQDAIDELQGSKIDKTSILQKSGEAEDKVMSQKAVSDKLNDLFNKVSAFEIIQLSNNAESIDKSGNSFKKENFVGTEITLEEGDQLFWHTCSINTISAVSIKKETYPYDVELIGTSNENTGWYTNDYYSYIAKKKCTIIITHRDSNDDNAIKVHSPFFQKEVYDIWKRVFPLCELVEFSVVNGKYISSYGDESSNAELSHTSPIHLNKGDMLFWTSFAGSNFACISYANADGTYSPIFNGKAFDIEYNYNFKASSECDVVISYFSKSAIKLIKISSIINSDESASREIISLPVVAHKNNAYVRYDTKSYQEGYPNSVSYIYDVNGVDKVFVNAANMNTTYFAAVAWLVNKDDTSFLKVEKCISIEFNVEFTKPHNAKYAAITYLANNNRCANIKGIVKAVTQFHNLNKDVFLKEIPTRIRKYGYYNFKTLEFMDGGTSNFPSWLYLVKPNTEYRIFGEIYVPSLVSQVTYFDDENMSTLLGCEAYDESVKGKIDVIIKTPNGCNYLYLPENLKIRSIGSTNTINCIGNSITEGQIGITNPDDDTKQLNSYPSELASLLPEYKIYNYGYGGNNPSSILACAGLSDIIVNQNFVLSKKSVTISNESELSDTLIGKTLKNFMYQGTNGYDADIARKTGYIDNIPVSLYKRSETDGTILVYSDKDITIPIKSGSTIHLKGVENINAINIIFIGDNDKEWYFNIDSVINDMRKVVHNLPNNHYLIIGECTSVESQKDSFISTNNALRSEFGHQFIDLQRYLCSQSPFIELGYNPSSDSDITEERVSNGVYSDEYGISNNLRPSSFWRYSYTPNNKLIDNVHYSQLGYKAIAYKIYTTLLELGWIF